MPGEDAVDDTPAVNLRKVGVYVTLVAGILVGGGIIASEYKEFSWSVVKDRHNAATEDRVTALKVLLDGSPPREGTVNRLYNVGITLGNINTTLGKINKDLDEQRDVSGSLACGPAGGDVADGHCVFFEGGKPTLVPLDEPQRILDRRNVKPRALRAVRAAKESTP